MNNCTMMISWSRRCSSCKSSTPTFFFYVKPQKVVEHAQSIVPTEYLILKNTKFKGPFRLLPNNFNHQIHPSVLFMVRNFYQLYLPVLFMAEKFSPFLYVVEFVLTIKTTSKFDHSISNHKNRPPLNVPANLIG